MKNTKTSCALSDVFVCIIIGFVDRDRVHQLYEKWTTYRNADGREALQFKGLQLQQLPDFKTCFQLNFHIFQLCEDGSAFPVFKSTEGYNNTVYLNHLENHLSYIKDFHCTQRNTNANYAMECSIT